MPDRRSIMLALALVFALVAAACGDDDGSTGSDPPPIADDSGGDDEPSDDDSTAPADDSVDDDGEPEGDASVGGEMDLGDFPIPAPAGGTVEFDQGNVRIVSYPVAEFDNLVAFYDEWLTAGDWSPPEGIDPSVAVLEEFGQFSATGFVSETELHTAIGTIDGDRVDVALSAQG